MKKPQKVKSLTENASNPRLKWKIVITKTGNIVAWSGTSGSFPVEQYRGCPFYPSWEVFEETTTVADIKTLAMRYDVQLPRKCTKLDASLFIWDELCNRATPGEPASDYRVALEPASRKKLSNRMYELVHLTGQDELERDKTLANMPPQAKACLAMLKEFKMDKVSEADFKELILKSGDRLHTRQDPWRIFQYYRGNMIRDRWIRLI
jgi:hypothetical protein